jgi:uncharacterized protein YuzE
LRGRWLKWFRQTAGSDFGAQFRNLVGGSYALSRSLTAKPCTMRSRRETDSLYIDLNARPSVDSREVQEGVVLDFDAEGQIVGIDIQHASEILDLATLETESLPVSS